MQAEHHYDLTVNPEEETAGQGHQKMVKKIVAVRVDQGWETPALKSRRPAGF